jgi:aminopeptidase
MSLREFEEFVYGAALVHEPDPIAAWRAISREQQRLIDWLIDEDQVRRHRGQEPRVLADHARH